MFVLIEERVLEKIKPSVKLLRYLSDAPRVIASAGKSTLTSKDVDRIIEDMDGVRVREWVIELIKRGHGSPLEHSIYVYEVICSRVASHQLVRHRIASYTQLSQRYSDKYLRSLVKTIGSKLGRRVPEKPVNRSDYDIYSKVLIEYLDTINSFNELLNDVGEAFIVPPSIVKAGDEAYLRSLIKSVATYYKLLSLGISYEDARYVLPQAVKTRLMISMNARELFENFLPLRMCSRAQWEIRYIAWSLWKLLVEVHPDIFTYAGPRCILYDNRIRSDPCSLDEFLSGVCRPVSDRCPELVLRDSIVDCIKNAQRDPWTN